MPSRKGDVVLVTGAVGSVGRVAVFVAKAAGAKVWAGVRGKQKAEAATLGADGVVALDNDADRANLPLLDGIADTMGGPTLAKLFGNMKPGGTIGSVVGEPVGAKEHGFVVRGSMTHPDAQRLRALAEAVADARRASCRREGDPNWIAPRPSGGVSDAIDPGAASSRARLDALVAFRPKVGFS